ncbi:MAG: glycosyltransferase family 2 protein [Flavobacterium sp.]
MKTVDKISIIIPTFNRAHLIGETLESVIAQTYPNWECLVVDDGSTDETESILASYTFKDSRIKYFKRPKHLLKGANACRNFGFQLSTGAYINWFDDDDLMHEDKLSIQLQKLQESEHHFSVCQTLVFENSPPTIIGLRSEQIYSSNVFYDYLSQNIVWMTPSALWKKSFLNTFDYLFDETLQAAQEWEFHCRVLLNCYKYDVVNEPLVYIRKHQNSISYNDNHKGRGFHYFLARLKVFKLISNDEQLNEATLFLKKYLLNSVKRIIRSRNLKDSMMIYRHLAKNNVLLNSKGKVAFFLSMLSFLVLGRGEFLFRYLSFK